MTCVEDERLEFQDGMQVPEEAPPLDATTPMCPATGATACFTVSLFSLPLDA